MPVLIIPLLILGTLGSYAAGLGLASRWHILFPLQFVISGALQISWIAAAAKRTGSPVLIAVCWIAVLYLTRRGIATLYSSDSSFIAAILLQGICLLLALSLVRREPWAERLARWRRSRSDILVQLRMGQGILPWSRSCLRQFTTGAADLPLGSDYQRFAAALADAEHRLRLRLGRAAVPEQLRQSILENVSAIVARAETAAAQGAIELGQHTLTAAALCRDQCERMVDLSASERNALARRCEQALLELIGN